MELVLDAILGDLDDPHAVGVGADLASDGRGHDQLEVVVEPTSGVSVIMTAKDLSDASVGELSQHFLPEVFGHVEVELFLVGIGDEPRDVLKDQAVFRPTLLQPGVQPRVLFKGQIRNLAMKQVQ